MKKYLFALGVALASAFTLTNCTEEIQNPQEGKTPYTIYANAAETKTANDGLSTVWVEGDALNVFHAAAGSTEYSANTKFTLTNAASGQFDTEELAGELSAVNDWYVLYPYDNHVTTPASVDAGYINVGSVSIVQKGYDNMDHLSGNNCPLYGVAKGVSVQNLPGLSMNHLTSVAKVEVTNNAGKAMTISNVALTANEDIVGTYYVNFAGEDVVYTGSGERYVSSIATLTVTDAAELPAGETAVFYIPVKPFVAAAGTDLVLSVNGEAKTLTMPKDVVFEAGSIKTLKYSVDKVVEQEVLSISEVIAADDKAQVLTAGLVVGTYARGVLIQDETGYLLVYDGSKAPAKVGDKIEVSGTKTMYAGMAQIGTPVVTVKSSNNSVTHPSATVLDGPAMDQQLSATAVSYVEYTGVLTVSGNYYNVKVDGTATAIGSISYPEASLGLADLNGKTIKVKGYFIGVSSGKYVNTMVVSVEEATGEDPEPEPEPGTATFDFNANEWGLPVSENVTGKKELGNIVEPLVSGDVTMTVYKGTASTATRLWQGSSKVDLRAYKGSSLAFSVPEGYVITKMIFNADAMSDASVISASGTFASKEWTGTSNPVVLTFAPDSETIKINTITVEYCKGTGDSPELPEESDPTPEPEPEPEPETPPTSSGTKTVAEFISAADTQNYYELTGTVSNFNSSYCSFDLIDATGSIYVYSVMSLSKTEWGSKIANGGTVTLLGKYLYYEKNSKHEVVDAYITSFVPGEEPEPEPEPEGAYTLSFADEANRTSYTAEQQVWEQNGITVTNDKSASQNEVGNYTNPARFYKGSSLTVEKAGMTKIEFYCNSYKTSYPTDLQSSITTGNVSVSNKVVTVIFTNAVNSLYIETLAGQVRLDKLVVYTN